MSGRTPASNDHVAKIEVGLLSLVFELYPEGLPADELVHRTMEGDPVGKERDYESALRLLRHAELVRETDGRILPTRAALHFDQLPF
jgi:hypothetical protein